MSKQCHRWYLTPVICAEPNSNIVLAYASTHILIFILANLLIYMAFYLTMKLLCGERPTNWVQTIVDADFDILTSNCFNRLGPTPFAAGSSPLLPWSASSKGFLLLFHCYHHYKAGKHAFAFNLLMLQGTRTRTWDPLRAGKFKRLCC